MGLSPLSNKIRTSHCHGLAAHGAPAAVLLTSLSALTVIHAVPQRPSTFQAHRLFLSEPVFYKVVLLSLQVKCDHYWPFTEEPIAYGDITVEMISEEEQDDWACRCFRINYVSHEARAQVLSPLRGPPRCQQPSPTWWKRMRAQTWQHGLLQEESPAFNVLVSHFINNGVDEMAGLEDLRSCNKTPAWLRLRSAPGESGRGGSPLRHERGGKGSHCPS